MLATQAALRAEIAALRATCREADTLVEHASHTLEELGLDCAAVDGDHERLRYVAQQLNAVTLPELPLPPQYSFADATISSELEATSANIEASLKQCHFALSRLGCVDAAECASVQVIDSAFWRHVHVMEPCATESMR